MEPRPVLAAAAATTAADLRVRKLFLVRSEGTGQFEVRCCFPSPPSAPFRRRHAWVLLLYLSPLQGRRARLQQS